MGNGPKSFEIDVSGYNGKFRVKTDVAAKNEAMLRPVTSGAGR
jgi:hypothetical protein